MRRSIGWIVRSLAAGAVVVSSVAIAPSAGARDPVHDACKAGYRAVAGTLRAIDRVAPGPPDAPREVRQLIRNIASAADGLFDVAHPPNPCLRQGEEE